MAHLGSIKLCLAKSDSKVNSLQSLSRTKLNLGKMCSEIHDRRDSEGYRLRTVWYLFSIGVPPSQLRQIYVIS